MGVSTYMQGHFIKPRVESQYVTFSLKRDGSAIGVVGEVLFPQAKHSVHVKRELALFGLISMEDGGDALHSGGFCFTPALLQRTTVRNQCKTRRMSGCAMCPQTYICSL